MIIDLNAHIGHYPFRRIQGNRPHELIAAMDRWGIDLAVVSNLDSLLYRNASEGNKDLAHAVRRGQGRLAGIATIDPTYAGWEADLEQALDEWQCKAVRLMPNYHHYSLDDPRTGELLNILSSRNIPAVFHESFEDSRQKHLWDASGELRFRTVRDLMEQHENLRVVYLNARQIGSDFDNAMRGRVLFCFSRMRALLHGGLPAALDRAGFESVAFGTHMPLFEPATALIKLDVLGLTPEDRERIAWRNTAEFLSLNL